LVWALLVACTPSISGGLERRHAVTYSYNFDPDISRDGLYNGPSSRYLKAANSFSWRNSTERRSANSPTIQSNHEDPAWSPDGTQIAYVRIEGGRNTLHSVSLATRRDRQLMQFPLNIRLHPAWMPDGTSLPLCADDDLRPPLKNEAAIYRLDVKSGHITTLISGW
jgi:Tol biopolymer transport system component